MKIDVWKINIPFRFGSFSARISFIFNRATLPKTNI